MFLVVEEPCDVMDVAEAVSGGIIGKFERFICEDNNKDAITDEEEGACKVVAKFGDVATVSPMLLPAESHPV